MTTAADGQAAAKAVSHGEHAYRTLRRELLEGSIAPGSRLYEIEIAARLRVSRTPVREALRRLESDGFVQRLGRSKLVATPTGPDDLGDIGLLRVEIDGLAARLTAGRATTRDWSDLQRLLEGIGEAGDDDVALNAAHVQFHRGIYAVGFGPRMFLFVDNHVLPYLEAAVNAGAARAAASLRSHTELLRALSSGSVERAVQAARAHAEGGVAAAKSLGRQGR